MQPTGFQPTGFQPGPESTASGDVTVGGVTLVITIALLAGAVTVSSAATSKPPGGDDAPGHFGAPVRLVKSKPREERPELEELEGLYDRIFGIEPQTKAEKKAVKAVQKAVQRHVEERSTELPPTSEIDWVSLQDDLNAVLALRQAYERLVEDEDEDALIAILLAA